MQLSDASVEIGDLARQRFGEAIELVRRGVIDDEFGSESLGFGTPGLAEAVKRSTFPSIS